MRKKDGKVQGMGNIPGEGEPNQWKNKPNQKDNLFQRIRGDKMIVYIYIYHLYYMYIVNYVLYIIYIILYI